MLDVKYDIVVISSQSIITYHLPIQQNGRYWLYTDLKAGHVRVLEIIGRKPYWYLIKNHNYDFPEGFQDEEPLLAPIHFSLIHKQETLFIYYEENKQKNYVCYHLHKATEYTIGRTSTCAISIQDRMISNIHAVIAYLNGSWVITDAHSKNGIYVNTKRVQTRKLAYGDILQIMRYQLFFGKDFIMLPKQTLIKTDLIEYVPALDTKAEISTRFVTKAVFPKLEHTTYTVEIQPPSIIKESASLPFIVILGPGITMGISSFLMLMFSLWNTLQSHTSIMSILPTLTMSFSMMLSVMLWPLLTRYFEKKKTKQENIRLENAYLNYITCEKQKIYTYMENERQYRSRMLETTASSIGYLTAPWLLHHRTIKDNVFLNCALGIGSKPADITIQTGQLPIMIPDTNSWNQYLEFVQTSYSLTDTVIELDMKVKRHVGIYGEHGMCEYYMIDKILQLMLLHDPDDLHICIAIDEASARRNKLMQLPHMFLNGSRLLITKEEEGKHISRILQQYISKHSHEFIVLFIFQSKLMKRFQLKEFLENDHVCYMQITTCLEQLYPSCDAIIHLDKKGEYESVFFEPKLMTNIQIKEAINYYHTLYFKRQRPIGFPKSYTFLDMYECGNVEQLQIMNRWLSKKHTASLEAKIGIDEHQELIYLDAHESFHGPHGLIAGMTGSGKSEWLLTYLLSLAVSYSPLDVSFILIDYKGGGMAQAFENLPHTAGIITNLQQQDMQRCIFGLQKEIKKRQQLFLKAKQETQQTIMNIDQYRAKMIEGIINTPLSHLFIIADEFAELKQQQPEFMEDIKQISRLGRSLGIHLILATQKPSGVIDEQIWSNARFHICLKVQGKSDSTDMLKRDDAIYLEEAGRFYFQVGHNELFVKGQSGWLNAPYIPKDEYKPLREEKISFISITGDMMYEKKQLQRQNVKQTQLEAICAYIIQSGKQIDMHASPLWMKPLPDVMYKEMFHTLYPTQYLIGIIDDIDHQDHVPLYFDMNKSCRVAVYSDQEKCQEVMLNAISATLCNNRCYSYLLTSRNVKDCVLHVFDDVIYENDIEKQDSFFYQMEHFQHKEPIIIIIYPYEAFSNNVFERKLCSILNHEQITLNICLFITNVFGFSNRLSNYIKTQYCLMLSDKGDYQAILHNAVSYVSNSIYRGWMLFENHLAAFQMIYTVLQYQKTDTFKIPVLPSIVKLQEDPDYLYLGKAVDSKEDIWIIKNEALLICFIYDIHQPFLAAIKQQLNDLSSISFLTAKKLKALSYQDEFDQILTTHAILWIGEGWNENAYIFKQTMILHEHYQENEGLFIRKGASFKLKLVEEIMAHE